MDDDDEVVGEMPVFLSQDLASNLYLLQYPLRPSNRPYTDVGKLSSVKVKPMQKKLEVEYDLDTNSSNYDQDNVNGANGNSGSQPIKKLKLESRNVPPKTNYAIGVVREGNSQ